MTIDQGQTETVTQEPASVPQEPSFQEYVALRREGKPIETSKPAPVAKTEQKAAADSEPVETEEENEELEAKADDESEIEQPKKKGGFQRRIDKLNAAKAEAQRELEYWKAQAMKNGATEPAKTEPKVEAKQESVEGKPNPDAFETHAEYVEALTDWKLEQREKQKALESQQKELQSKHEAVLKAHAEREKAFAKSHDDYADTIDNLQGLKNATVEQIIAESDIGPELLYALGKDRALAEQICSMGPIAAAREMGKLELKLSNQASEPKEEPKKLTKAPAPIVPIGSGKGTIKKSPDEMSLSEYTEWRRKNKG